MNWDWVGGSMRVAAGRVLQVSLGERDAFWVPPSPEGWNVGGDRLWLGPERDWFWATDDPGDLAGHVVPLEIDPGEWRTVHDSWGEASFEAEPLLRNRHDGTTTRLRVNRQISLRYGDSARVEYEVRTTLELIEAPAGQEVSAWSVLQVPLGGVLEFGLTSGFLRFRDYLEPVDGKRFTVGDGRASIELDGRAMGKIGVRPDVFSGFVRYELAGLVVERQVDVQPTARYCDHPLTANRATQGDALQIFEDDGHYGGYAEIEHHSPAISGDGVKNVLDVVRTTVTVR